jgi:sortase A
MRARTRLAVVIVAAGAGLLAWGLWIPAKAALAQHLLERAWQRAQQGERAARPWPWADFHPAFRLSLPDHGRSFVVLSDASGAALAFAPGHVPSSRQPGEPGITVVGGHRDTHFSVLRDMTAGDRITVQDLRGGTFTYRVSEIGVRRMDDARIATDGQSHILVLATCYPFDAVIPGGPERFLVVARQVTESAQP